MAGFEEPRNSHPVQTEIWTARVDGTKPARSIFSGLIQAWNFTYSTFSEPRLAPDNRHAYFLIMLSATDDAVVRLDVATGETKLITTGGPYYVVTEGRYVGDLVVQQRKQFAEGFNQSFWLVSPDGKEIGLVGQSNSDVRRFLSNPARDIQ